MPVKRICLDPGHGGRDRSNRGPTGYVEADGTLAIALACRRILIAAGLNVIMTRGDDLDLCPLPIYDQASDLRARAEFANAQNADFFISIHTNAASNANANGTETYCYRWHSEGHKLAMAIQDSVVLKLGTTDRGVKESNFLVIRSTDMPAALCEVAFHTNPNEEAKLKDSSFLRKAGEAIAIGVIKHLGLPQPTTGTELEEDDKEEIPEPPPVTETPPVDDSTASQIPVNIIGEPECTVEQAEAWAKSRGATPLFVALASVYWYEAERYGVRPDLAYAQSAKETAFGRFGGVVDRSFCNWCGLKTASGGANHDPEAHARFPSDVIGVRAHLQHLCRYAGQPLPEGEEIVDPRYHLVKAGSARTVQDLGGKWAPSKDYGTSIVRDYLEPMLHFDVGEPQSVPYERYKCLMDELDAMREKMERMRPPDSLVKSYAEFERAYTAFEVSWKDYIEGLRKSGLLEEDSR